jgi:hypothetical protein
MRPLVTSSGRHLKAAGQLYVGITAEQAERWKSARPATQLPGPPTYSAALVPEVTSAKTSHLCTPAATSAPS